MKILVTGGAGFIGSHTCVELLNAGYEVVIADNLSNAKPEVVQAIETIAGKPVCFYRTDLRDKAGMQEIFAAHQIDAVIHFAGLKAVPESVQKPLEYYENNLVSTLVEAVTAGDVNDSIIDGKLVMKDRQVLTLDEEKILAEAKKRMRDISARAGI